MGTMWCRIHRFPACHLRHPPHASAPKSRILVTVPPAVYRPLNETPLSSQACIELSQCPTYRVTFSLIVQPVAFVLIFWATSSRVHTVLRLEILRESFGVYRLNIAANSVLHLDSIPRVLERDPLHTVLILPDHQRGRSRNGTRCCIWIHAWSTWLALVHTRSWGALRRRRCWTHVRSLLALLKLSLLHL